MVDKNVMDALFQKQNELERRVQTLDRTIIKLRFDLSTARAMLAFDAQNIECHEFLAHNSPRKLFKRGEIVSYCQDALKQQTDGLDTRELARLAIIRKGLNADDGAVRKTIVRSVSAAMKTARRKGIVISGPRRLGVRVWLLRPKDYRPNRTTRDRPTLGLEPHKK